MGFDITKDDLKKSQKCPAGMHLFTLVEVEDEYFNDKGTKVQKCTFESAEGHAVPYWFNSGMIGSIIEFIEAADNIKLTMEEFAGMNVDLKDYRGKKVAGAVSHVKDKSNRVQANIDAFYTADKVPF